MSDTEILCPDGKPPKLLALANDVGMQMTVMDWGATWLSCRVPVGGETREVLLGCDSLADHFSQTAYLGATIGRYANRIRNARLRQGGQKINLLPNQGAHQLHGGPEGFDRRRWRILEHSRTHALFGIDSPAGDQGFPGNLHATVCYRLQGNAVHLAFAATVDEACPICLTNHAYFNLDGIQGDIRRHSLSIEAKAFLPVDEELVPLGELADVAGSGFDFIRPKPIGRDFLCDEQQRLARGYDHAFLLDAPCRDLSRAAVTLSSGDGRLRMDLFTTLPALQLYTGNYLAGVPARHGGAYADHQGVALEAQFLPDSPNHPEWPQQDCWLRPGEAYLHETVLRFQA